MTVNGYRPNVRFRVDWDNDSFLNGAVPIGTPQNLIPNAAYAAGAKAAYVIGNTRYVDGEFKEVDELGFTALAVDHSLADKMVFGSNRQNTGFETPVGEAENLIDFEDYRNINRRVLSSSNTHPQGFPVYQASKYLATDEDFTGNLATMPNIFLPAGEYTILAWVRMYKGSFGMVSMYFTTSPAARTTTEIEYNTGSQNPSSWQQIAAVVNMPTDGYLTINLTTAMEHDTNRTTYAKFEFGGFMLLPSEWSSVSMDNRTVSDSTLGSTAWNSGTGRYIHTQSGNGARGATVEMVNSIPRDALIIKTDVTFSRVNADITGNPTWYIIVKKRSGHAELKRIMLSNFNLTTIASSQTFTNQYIGRLSNGIFSNSRSDDTFSGTFTDPSDIDIGFEYNSSVAANVGFDFNNTSYLVVPTTYWKRSPKPAAASDLLLESGKSYNLSFYASHDGVGGKDADIYIYGISLVDGSLTELYTSSFVINEERTRHVFTIPTLAATYGIYVEVFQVDANVTVTYKAFQLTEGSNPVTFNVGENAPLDDITPYVKSAAWKSGRNQFDDNMAYEGTLDITLNNDGQEFSIANVNSPYYGLLRQNLKIVFEIEYNFNWYPLWSGWTRYFDIVAGTNSSREVKLMAEQGIYRLREGSFSYAPTEDTRMDDVIKAIINSSGWRSAKSPFHTILSFDALLGINTYLQASDEIFSRIDVGRQSLSLVGMDWGRETTPDKALNDILSAEQGKLWIDREGGLVLVNRNHLINAEDKFVTAITLDNEVQDASYNHGEGIVNRIQVMYQEKKEVTNAVIWQSKSPIRIPKRDALNIYRRSTVRFPLHFTFEEKRQRTITKINSRMSDIDFTVTNADTGEVITNTSRMIWISVTSDGGNRLELQIRNEFDFPVTVDVTIYGNYLEGGQSQTVIVEDLEAQEFVQAVHEKIVETSVLSDLETAVNLAKWDISRYANPRGEFRVIETYADDPLILQRLLSWELGTILKVSEVQTGETNRFHIIIAEEGSYAAGDTVRVTHRLARGDDNYYNKVGYSTLRKGTLNHAPAIDMITADLFGSDGGEVQVVPYLTAPNSNTDKAVKIFTKRYNGAIWFGKRDAQRIHKVSVLSSRFARYSSITQPLGYTGVGRSFNNQGYIQTSEGGTPTFRRLFAFANSQGQSISGVASWTLIPRKPDTLMRFSATAIDTLGDTINLKWDMDTTNNLASNSTYGATTKTENFVASLTNTGESINDTFRNYVSDFIVKMPTNADEGVYVRLNSEAASGALAANATDPTELDMTKINNTTLKENTLYYVTLWAGAEVGETVNVDVVVVEHNAATERVVSLAVDGYGKYQGTFTTSASLPEPTASVFFRIKEVNIPVYVTGFAITEQDVDTLEEANIRQALAAYSFI